MRKKKFARNFFPDPENLKFSQLYTASLGLEGARRIFFKVTIDVSADMGGICVSRHKGYSTMASCRLAQKWAEMLHNPYILRVPNKGDKIKAQKSNKNQK